MKRGRRKAAKRQSRASRGAGLRHAIADDVIQCWCGASGTYEELFDSSGLDYTCGGSGTLNCVCGGDFCVCHYHGLAECYGCEDCRKDEDDDYGRDESEDW